MANVFRAICDFLWVLQAFFRGKVLRQRDYMLSANNVDIYEYLLDARGVTEDRFARLMRWWGPQEMADEQIQTLEFWSLNGAYALGHIPFKFWNPITSTWLKYESVRSAEWLDRKEMEAYMN